MEVPLCRKENLILIDANSEKVEKVIQDTANQIVKETKYDEGIRYKWYMKFICNHYVTVHRLA